MVRQMNRDTVEPVRDRRTGWAARFVIGPEHEMINQQLRSSSKEISERRFALVSLEFVFLVDLNPRQFLPLLRHVIAQVREFFLVVQQLPSSFQPLLSCTRFLHLSSP